MRTFVVGDIHGACRALVQCLSRARFDYANDQLICLGDVCDGWPETKDAIQELLKINHLVYLLGNHDQWTLEWMKSGYAEKIWLMQGGEATVRSFHGEPDPQALEFLNDAKLYHIQNNTLFVHAGINPREPLEEQGADTFLWDRALAQEALMNYFGGNYTPLTRFDEVYVGHTPTPFGKPVLGGGVWLMDTGAGWSGVLSMMDIATKEIFISDPVPSLYPGIEARQRKA
jgi:serine/threonine protein phosphatase 1